MARIPARTPPPDGGSLCADCSGVGRVRIAEVRRRLFIFWRTVTYVDSCWTCNGTGRVPRWKARR